MDKDRLILSFDPFEGDFGEQDDHVFSNKMVIGRKIYKCSHCCGHITKGERHRYQSSKFGGELMTHRWCSECCEIMAECVSGDYCEDDIDPHDKYEERSMMHENQIGCELLA